MEIRYLTYLIQNINRENKYILCDGDSVESFTFLKDGNIMEHSIMK